MAHFMFVDESGHDRRASPYEVLAGVAVEDRDLWDLIQAVHAAEHESFGIRYAEGVREIKGKRLLKTKTFRLAAGMPPIDEVERIELARDCLSNGAAATPRHLAALAQAKLAFVARVLELCVDYRCRAFAIVVDKSAPRPSSEEMPRRDYAFLFERFFYFLEDVGPSALGAVVFDENEKSRSHLLVGQMCTYFEQAETGRQRAGRVIPEPFFVHSDLTTGIQIVDLIAYVISWGFRGISDLTEPARAELEPFVRRVCDLRHHSVREIGGNPEFGIWSFHYVRDLRPRGERQRP
jgi:hypothetical protein